MSLIRDIVPKFGTIKGPAPTARAKKSEVKL